MSREMIDGFLSGVFGGFFGPALARWAEKYRYWVIFFTVTVGVHISSLIQDIWKLGGAIALYRYLNVIANPVGFGIPVLIGLLATLCVFSCTAIAGRLRERDRDE